MAAFLKSFASSNTRWLYVLIRRGKRWKRLELYHEVVIVDNIKLHKEAFVLEFLQQFSQYCLWFNLISIYFTPLCGFYWGCACFIGRSKPEVKVRRDRVPLFIGFHWAHMSWFGYLLLILSSFTVFCAIRILFIRTLRFSLCIYCWIKYSSSLL